jgi:hypothetical protein
VCQDVLDARHFALFISGELDGLKTDGIEPRVVLTRVAAASEGAPDPPSRVVRVSET